MKAETEWVEWARATLDRLRNQPSAPELDIEWLLQRCDDTLKYSGHWREVSARQLARDILQFDQDFPGVMSEEAIEKLRAWVK